MVSPAVSRPSPLPLALLALACAGLQPVPTDWPPWPALSAPAVEAVGELPDSVRARAGADGRWQVTLTLLADEPARSVHLAGSFNDWSREATPLARGADGRWRVEVPLEAGRWSYKFVLDGERWMSDPANPAREDDGHGGSNSLLLLGRAAQLRASDASAGDASIEAAGLRHDPDSAHFRQHLSAGRALLRYRSLAGDLEQVQLSVRGAEPQPMHLALRGSLYDLWETSLVVDPEGCDYTFLLTDGELRVSHAATYRLEPSTDAPFRTPEWAKDAVWYQVMLDRFRNGEPGNDPPHARAWRSSFMEPDAYERGLDESFWSYYVFRRRYGGDLAGLRQALPYLSELGVNALYLNPVFQAGTYHGYDAVDYLHVDERYGAGDDYAAAAAGEDPRDPATWTWSASDRMFLEFVREAHAAGFKVILDGVFNHVGTRHPAFRDVAERGADSAYADWFEVRSWEPFEYAGWAGFGELPVFKKAAHGFASDEVKQHVFDVTRRWMDPNGDGDPSDGIDGWRLDVPNEVAGPFWVEWRKLVKSINPDAYITGEIWDEAGEWLSGDRFDAVMNYPFARAALAWVGDRRNKIAPSELDRRLAELRLAYPAQATYVQQNLYGSHDTDRLASMLKNPDRSFDGENRVQDGANYDAGRPGPTHYKRARLLALLQMTYVGAPMVYYGDEVGMFGADDPICRKPMLWKDHEPYDDADNDFVDEAHLRWYQRVIALRRGSPALSRGSFRTLLADDEQDVWAFERRLGDERVLVALNASRNSARVRLPELGEGEWESVLGDARADEGARVRVPALGGRVWRRR